MTTRTATYHRHSDDYYYFLIKSLISLVNRRFTHRAIAAALNAEGITSPTGDTFNAQKVANTLSRLRHHDKYRSLVYQGLLNLCRDGRLTLAECMPLLRYTKKQPLRASASPALIARDSLNARDVVGTVARDSSWLTDQPGDTSPQISVAHTSTLSKLSDAGAQLAPYHQWLTQPTARGHARTRRM